jgi:hypothetical protein
MLRRRWLGMVFVGLTVAVACGGSDENSGDPDGGGGNAGSSAGGSSGSGADSGTTGGTAGSSAGSVGVGGSSTGGTAGSTGVGGSATGGSAGSAGCGTTECSDCVDNDGDGLVDMADQECIAPADNDEGTFATGIPGDNIDACKQDCFFDGNSGQGDDGCNWELKCDPANPGAPKCPYDPNYKNCPPQQSQKCLDFCTKLTPNGCDCFGCCTVPLPGGGTKNILLTPTCTLADVNDPAKCPTCTPTASCDNPCEHCELCLGKTELPPDCTPPDAGTGGAGGSGGSGGVGGSGGGCPTPVCPSGIQPCGLECLPNCPANTYCLTGCCIPIG